MDYGHDVCSMIAGIRFRKENSSVEMVFKMQIIESSESAFYFSFLPVTHINNKSF